MNLDGYGRVAVVTGGAGGLGLSIARSLIGEGKRVAVVDIDREALEKIQKDDFFINAGSRVMFLYTDVSVVQEIQDCVKVIVSTWNRIDILINNAGIRFETGIEEITPDEWNKVLAVNLGGTFFFSQAVIKIMKEQEWGRIVNISGAAGQYGSLNTGAHYGASKAGQILLTKVFARELAAYGITVNDIAPAILRSPDTEKVAPDKLRKIIQTIPVGRMGEMGEVAKLVSYLVSESMDYVTGATLDINGGLYMR